MLRLLNTDKQMAEKPTSADFNADFVTIEHLERVVGDEASTAVCQVGHMVLQHIWARRQGLELGF